MVENLPTKITLIVAPIVYIVEYLVGGWYVGLTWLLIFMALDVLTGFYRAIMRGNLRSKTAWQGISRKSFTLVVVIIAAGLDKMFLSDASILRNAVVALLISVEGLSLTENLSQIGVYVPKFIKDRLQIIKEEAESAGTQVTVKDSPESVEVTVEKKAQ